MFTQETKDRKIKQAQEAIDAADKRVAAHQGNLDKAKADKATAEATLEWVKQMPVNGQHTATAPADVVAEPEPEPAQ